MTENTLTLLLSIGVSVEVRRPMWGQGNPEHERECGRGVRCTWCMIKWMPGGSRLTGQTSREEPEGRYYAGCGG